jgi:hypothetical protein
MLKRLKYAKQRSFADGVAHGSKDPRRSIIRIRLGLASCCLWLRPGFGVKSDQGRCCCLATLAGATAPGVQRPWAGAADCQRKEAAGRGDVLIEMYRLIRTEVEKERRQ